MAWPIVKAVTSLTVRHVVSGLIVVPTAANVSTKTNKR